jgi:hypothetical protein
MLGALLALRNADGTPCVHALAPGSVPPIAPLRPLPIASLSLGADLESCGSGAPTAPQRIELWTTRGLEADLRPGVRSEQTFRYPWRNSRRSREHR